MAMHPVVPLTEEERAAYRARFEAGLPASRLAALERARAALEHIEAAQRELVNASADLSAINGGAALQHVAMTMHDKVKAFWYRVNDKIAQMAQAPLARDKFTLDGMAAPDGVVSGDEHPHRGCGGQIGGPRAHGLHRTVTK
jgi:hypothetical protein